MAVITEISRYFNEKSVAQLLEDKEPIRTPVWNRVFTKDVQLGLGYVSRKIVSDTTGNVPLIKRGTSSIPLNDGNEQTDLFEPQPLAINHVLKAKDMIDLKQMDNEFSLRQWIADKFESQKNVIDRTIEALCCQALRGSIDYSIKVFDGDLGDYKVDFGSTLAVPAAFAGNWDTASITDIFKDLQALANTIKLGTIYGSRIGILAGENVYNTLIGKAMGVSTSTSVNMKVEPDTVILNGWKIENFSTAQYTNIKTGQKVKAVGDDEILLFAEDAPFQLTFLAIDDFDAHGEAKLIARDFYPKLIKEEDPSAYKIMTQSKFFPMPVPGATIIATCL